MNRAEEIATILLEIKAITLSPNKPFTYTSGMISPIYTDNRLLISYPEKRRAIVSAMKEIAEELKINPDIIAGTATAGIPWAAWLSEELDLPMVYVRGEKKSHGKGKQIEGELGKESIVLLIEDLISTGKSSLAAVDALRNENSIVEYCIAIFSYGLTDSENAFKENHVTLKTLTSIEAIADVALENGTITNEEKDLILEWKKDPWNWNK